LLKHWLRRAWAPEIVESLRLAETIRWNNPGLQRLSRQDLTQTEKLVTRQLLRVAILSTRA
jgi:hypothetical protein